MIAEQRAAQGNRGQHDGGVDLQGPADQDRLHHVALELLHHQHDGQHRHRGPDPVGDQRDQGGDGAGDEGADDRDEAAEERQDRDRQRERHAEEEHTRAR